MGEKWVLEGGKYHGEGRLGRGLPLEEFRLGEALELGLEYIENKVIVRIRCRFRTHSLFRVRDFLIFLP